jgi:hypothetical protein
MSEEREGLIRELVDFEDAYLLMDFEPPNPSLIVGGTLRYPMEVELEPRATDGQPEYQPIEVVGYREEAVIEVETPFSVQRSLKDLPMGSKGLEVIGATRSEKLDLPGH